MPLKLLLEFKSLLEVGIVSTFGRQDLEEVDVMKILVLFGRLAQLEEVQLASHLVALLLIREDPTYVLHGIILVDV